MSILLETIIDLVPFAVALVASAAILLLLRFRNNPRKSQLSRSDFVVFEAKSINIQYIKADLAESGWHFVNSQPTSTNAFLYRFEKGGAGARCLSGIYDFERYMPKTANRIVGNDSLIKIHSYGRTVN